MLFTFVRVCFESFRRDLNEAKAVYISVIKINVLLLLTSQPSEDACLARRQRIVPREECGMLLKV